MLEQSADGDDQKGNETFGVSCTFLQELTLRTALRLSRDRRSSSIPFGNPDAERRQGGLSMTDRPRLDSDLEGFQLVFPVSRPPAVRHPSYPPRKLRYEGDNYPT